MKPYGDPPMPIGAALGSYNILCNKNPNPAPSPTVTVTIAKPAITGIRNVVSPLARS
jgi:hypothetical protein